MHITKKEIDDLSKINLEIFLNDNTQRMLDEEFVRLSNIEGFVWNLDFEQKKNILSHIVNFYSTGIINSSNDIGFDLSNDELDYYLIRISELLTLNGTMEKYNSIIEKTNRGYVPKEIVEFVKLSLLCSYYYRLSVSVKRGWVIENRFLIELENLENEKVKDIISLIFFCSSLYELGGNPEWLLKTSVQMADAFMGQSDLYKVRCYIKNNWRNAIVGYQEYLEITC